MVNLERFSKTEYEGKIVRVNEGTLRELLEAKGLAEASIQKWTRHDKEDQVSKLDREHLQPVVVHEGTSVDGPYLMIPATAGGYRKSNMRDFIEKNKLPFDTGKWVGMECALMLNDDGFLRVAL